MGCSFCKDGSRRLSEKHGSQNKEAQPRSAVLTSIVHHLSHPNDKPKSQYPRTETKRVRYNHDSEGNKTINGYVHQKHLGLGSFGKVGLYLCADNNQLYAIKSMKKRQLMKRRFGVHGGRTHWDDVMREIFIMQRLDHQNVIKIHEVINDQTDNKIHIIMEYAEDGPLFKGEEADTYIRIMSDETIRDYFSQMVEGLQYIHSMNVIHRDIKPENILVHRGVVKIADFGVSYPMAQGDPNFSSDADPVDDSDHLKKTVGSPAFLPPELCANDCERVTGPPIDVWALGVTLYFLYYGKIPFNGDTEALLYDNVRTQEITFPTETSEELKDLLKKLLQKNPENRSTLEQVKNHSWLRNQP